MGDLSAGEIFGRSALDFDIRRILDRRLNWADGQEEAFSALAENASFVKSAVPAFPADRPPSPQRRAGYRADRLSGKAAYIRTEPRKFNRFPWLCYVLRELGGACLPARSTGKIHCTPPVLKNGFPIFRKAELAFFSCRCGARHGCALRKEAVRRLK